MLRGEAPQEVSWVSRSRRFGFVPTSPFEVGEGLDFINRSEFQRSKQLPRQNKINIVFYWSLVRFLLFLYLTKQVLVFFSLSQALFFCRRRVMMRALFPILKL